jgi:hypothetical protein
MTTDRAVSVPLQYVLLLGTITVLSAGLFVGMGGFVQAERTEAVEETLDVIGHRLSVDIATADRLAGDLDGQGNVTVAVDLPTQVAGSTYVIQIESLGGNRSRLALETTRPNAVVTVDVVTEVALDPGTASGGAVSVVYDPTTDTLEVRNA